MECRSWIRGTRGVSLPFTDACSALTSETEPNAATSLLDATLAHGRERSWRFAEFRGDNDIATVFPGISPSATPWGHTLDLSGSADAAFARFDPAVRRAIRKAEKSEVQVEVTRDPQALKDFYRLHCLTRSRHGVPPQPFSFFEAIQKHVIDLGHGFVVVGRRSVGRRSRGAQTSPLPIAASVYFHFGHHAIYKFGASDQRFQDLRANNLVMWKAIQHLASIKDSLASSDTRHSLPATRLPARSRPGTAKAGPSTPDTRHSRISILDFGRTDPSNEGLRAFKLGWGTTETRLRYFRYDFRSNKFVGATAPSRLVGRLGWLPGPVARMLGAVLYPHWE